jgi:3-hydroxyisobutyrate dehydrogenase
MSNPAPVVGIVGLGSMGSGMAANLLRAGFPLAVNDVREEAARDAVAGGATWAATTAELAAACDVVITMLPTPRHVEEVLHGEHGLLAGLRDGSTWVDMSTSVPEVQASVADLARQRGISLVDAPVSGMATGARTGRLQIFVGGQEADVRRLRPIFEAMGDPERILHVGGNGTGYAVKLMVNQLWFSHLVATAEVLAVGTQAGVDVEVLRTALLASPAASGFLERDVLSILTDGDYDEGFAIALACKDLGLSIDLARATGVPVELSAVVEQVFRRARATYGDQAGEMTPFKLYEDMIGRQIRLKAPVESA